MALYAVLGMTHRGVFIAQRSAQNNKCKDVVNERQTERETLSVKRVCERGQMLFIAATNEEEKKKTHARKQKSESESKREGEK